MNTGTAALAVTGGYLLGRFHKARWAMALAGAAAGRRMRSGNGGGLLKSEEFGKITENLRGELAAAGKAAAVAATARQIDAVSDRLAERTQALRAGPEGPSDEEPDTESDEDEVSADEESAADEDDGEEPAKRRGGGKRTSGSTSGKSGGGTAGKSAAKKPASAGGTRKKAASTRPAGAAASRKKTASRGQARTRTAGKDSGAARSGGRGKER